jgi:DNA modification methylase
VTDWIDGPVPALVDGPVTVYLGGALDVLARLPDDSVHVCVTSPPYWGLRSYLPNGHYSKRLELGTEPTPQEYVAALVEIMREVRRVLRPDATCWLNVGDSYAHGGNGSRDPDRWPKQSRNGNGFRSVHAKGHSSGLKSKNLALVPERLAIALQDDGWYIRSRICWAKTSAMPESVKDRPSSAWEHIWLLTKSAAYYYDPEAVREPATKGADGSTFTNGKTAINGQGRTSLLPRDEPAGRNMRNFWLLGPEPYPEAHFAVYPSEVPRRAIAAGTSERGCCPECGAPWVRCVEREQVDDRTGIRMRNVGGRVDGFTRITASGGIRPDRLTTTGWRPGCDHHHEAVPCVVLDPFAGSGTTLAVARRTGRKAIGVELNPNYLALIKARITEAASPLLETPAAPEPKPEQSDLFAEVAP